jgi:hypothetical protein
MLYKKYKRYLCIKMAYKTYLLTEKLEQMYLKLFTILSTLKRLIKCQFCGLGSGFGSATLDFKAKVRSGFLSGIGSGYGQNGPDPPTLPVSMHGNSTSNIKAVILNEQSF